MRRILVLTVAFAAFVALAVPASASKPMEVHGTEAFSLVPTCDPTGSTEPACRTANGNVFITVLNPAVKTGTFEGTQLFDGTITLFSNGDFVFHGTVTFTGTVEGCGDEPGTVVFKGEGGGNFATGLTRSRQHATGQGTLGVRANIDLISADDPSTSVSEITGTYSC